MPRVALLSVLALLAAAAPAWAQAIGLEPPASLTEPPAEATRTASGLASLVIAPGTRDATPDPTNYVTLYFAGWTTDGNLVDSATTGQAPTFPLDRTLPGFRECVGLMQVGEHRRCWLPEALAYRGQEGRPRGALVFDVQLLELYDQPSVAPGDVAAPPEDAERTESGIAYRRLRPGTGARHPTAVSQVRVQYTGWTTNGIMFDTSLNRGQPAVFQLNGVIAGWTEGLQLMVEGERMRFWIPEELAYEGAEGAPAGMLVFDVELISIDS